MGHIDDRLASPELVDARQTLLLESRVAHSQDFVNQQDVLVNLHGNSKPKADDHTTGVLLDWRINKLPQFGKIQDLFLTCLDFPLGQPQQQAVQNNILSARQIRMKPCPEFD